MASQRNRHGPAEVIHFGLIRPNKGIEDVLEFARQVSAEGLPVSVKIMGSSPAKQAAYLASVQDVSARLPVTWELNLNAETVAERLARATMAYMPFPDGASERHASILAALANGLPVLTTKGRFTPEGMEHAARFCETPSEAVATTRELLEKPALREALGARAYQYAARFSWESIAESHIKIYEQVAATNAVPH